MILNIKSNALQDKHSKKQNNVEKLPEVLQNCKNKQTKTYYQLFRKKIMVRNMLKYFLLLNRTKIKGEQLLSSLREIIIRYLKL